MATNCILNGNSAVSGGGAFNGILSHCKLIGNSAKYDGGGSSGSALNNCTLIGNSANSGGGGSYQGTLNNCMLSLNSANNGGGANGGTLNNCTLSGNLAQNRGGGTYYSTLNNCIIWGNSADSYKDIYNGLAKYCCASDLTEGVNGCTTNDPYFANYTVGRFDLLAQSPCINAGTNIYAYGDTDLGGNQRIMAGTIDMGVYESPDLPSYTIATSIEGMGTMEPSNPRVFEGYDQPMSISLPLGYYVASLTVNGGPVTPADSYVFRDVHIAHTIAATVTTDPHVLTVENGSGDGSYLIWTVVDVLADPAPSGLIFRRWTTEPASYSSGIGDPYSMSTTFTMPETTVVLTAQYGPAYYVDAAQSDDSGDGLSWATAKQTIQSAVDSAEALGCTVWVTNGTYNIGGAVALGQSLTNRVYIDKAMTVKSVNGPEFTIIEGVAGSNGGRDVDGVRGVYVADYAILSGFTVTNGYTMELGDNNDRRGGGLFMELDGQATNCILSGNSAYYGGGAFAGTLNNCTVIGNEANYGGGAHSGTLNSCKLSGNAGAVRGGGSYGGTLNNCLISANSADTGGGSYSGTLNSCTISTNSASYGGGSYSGSLNNCIVWGNEGGHYKDTYSVSANHSCASDITAGVNGCITNVPHFVNSVMGRFALLANSPCIDAGTNVYASADTDLTGNPRIVAASIDMGAYESPEVSTYTITTSVEGAGTLVPSSPVVFDGYDQPISIIPSRGYYLVSLTVDGIPVVLADGYTFNNVQASHTIAATFATDPHSLIVEDGTGAGSYTIWTEVDVVANTAADSFVFLRWTTEPAQYSNNLSNPHSSSTTFTMPETDVILTANYGPIYHVDASQPDDSGDGLSWATAKQRIQAAIILTETNGTIWVTNGTYNVGGAVAAGQLLTNRVCIDKAITVQSVNGPEVTFIEGASGSNGGHDVDSVRGVYLADGGILSGFTVTNGYTMATGGYEGDGGGIFLEGGGMATNCIISGNAAYYQGGGIYGGTLDKCTLRGNSANYGGGSCQGTLKSCALIGNSAVRTSSSNGGGSYYGTLNNCLLINNWSWGGGGSYRGTLNNCTLSGNTGYKFGDGACRGTLNNCIAWGNPGSDIYLATANSCCALNVTEGENGNISSDPLFVDAANGDFTLQTNSPCINAGMNSYMTGGTDLAGGSRMVYGVVDMGAYEFSGAIPGIADFDHDGIADRWEGTYYGSTSGCDPDGHDDSDPLSNLEEYIAGTNPMDAASLFQATYSGQVEDGFLVEWDAVSNRLYSVFRTSSLTNSFQLLEGGIAYPQSSYTDTNAVNNAKGYYRLEVQVQE